MANGPSRCSFHNKGTSEIHLTGYFEPVRVPSLSHWTQWYAWLFVAFQGKTFFWNCHLEYASNDDYLGAWCQLRMACPMIWKTKNPKRKRKRRRRIVDWWFPRWGYPKSSSRHGWPSLSSETTMVTWGSPILRNLHWFLSLSFFEFSRVVCGILVPLQKYGNPKSYVIAGCSNGFGSLVPFCALPSSQLGNTNHDVFLGLSKLGKLPKFDGDFYICSPYQWQFFGENAEDGKSSLSMLLNGYKLFFFFF